ncbi:DHA2 family efflux MFS transporter permease subunit [Saccharibacillus sp. CPCC 101409]|uniref:DHA2 family efflux MFS transporter permease subunit n=1 Tax=Saccharibacillus sp. CPCC 101409 TaxID=3058041 RepID=UPI00267408E2|nr:DHA2 family efflux MFS transporter permease subunit [Saccharibacillus sp. CPCC 101409]MDO3409151.1 DHA2 family efflux MFS transporter permease subunit [Saccharibacillus sp. CPCC 101409]
MTTNMSQIAASKTAVQDIHTIKKGPILMALLIGAFVALLNQTLLNVALPTMAADLKVETSVIQWLSTGFMLVNGVMVPVTAYLMARFTTRKLFITAMSLFTVGTILCAFSGSFDILLAGRMVQAAGAGILMPLMTFTILTIFPIEKRGSAMGLIGVAMIFAPAIGPTLSGWMVEHYDWHSLFYLILPFGIISIILGMVFMRNVTETTRPKLDVLAVILSTIGFGGILYGFSQAGTEGWGATEVVWTLGVGAIALLLFVIRELRSDIPILEMRVFKYDVFTLTTVINIIATMALFSGMILLPLYLQNVLEFTPVQSGLMLLPGAILMGIMSPITGYVFDKIGARWLAVAGLAIMTITTYEFSQLTVDTSYTHLITVYTIRMFGMSLMMMPIQTAGLNQLPQRLNAHGTAMSNTLRTIAGALGTALLVSIMTSKAAEVGKQLIISRGLNPNDASQAAQLGAVKMEALVQGINHSFVIATWMTAAAFVLAFFIKRVVPNREGMHEQKTVPTTASENMEANA